MDTYQDKLWTAWSQTPKPVMTDIPVAKAQLLGRVGNFEPRTTTWMTSLNKPTWRAVRDAHTGHTIHVVSDRPFASLANDLERGLQLLGWMSQRIAVTWYWWDQPWARRLPAHTDPRQEHLNGGWAVPGVPEVHVYRREEAHKVLLHETIHALGLDIPASILEPVRGRFDAALKRHLWPHLGEAFTELYAEWLYAICSAKTKKQAVTLWSAQLACSSKQAAQVWARIHDATADEDTNVFAYYVLKWVLMQHLDSVLLAPTASAAYWFDWWLAAKPDLDRAAKRVVASESTEIKMGMTCEA